MLKLISVLVFLSLGLLTETKKVVKLAELPLTKTRAIELNKLKLKYNNLITVQSENDAEQNLMKYKSSTYRAIIDISNPGEYFSIIFKLDSFSNVYSKGLLDYDLFSFSLRHSAIVLGGIKSQFYRGGITYIPFASKTYWQFEMDAAISDTKLCVKCQAIVDIGASLTVVPNSQYKPIMHAIGATFNAKYHTYTLDCKTTESLPALKLNIANTTLTLVSAEYIIQTDDICSTAFESIGTEVWILGEVFLRKYYTIIDVANERVGLALAS